MGQVCSRRQAIVAVGNTEVLNRWSRLVGRYLQVTDRIANAQRIFSAASVLLRSQPRSLLDNTTRARRSGLL